VQREVVDRVAKAIVEGTVHDGSVVVIDAGDEGLVIGS
jgi:hypothetical protein